MTSAIYSAGLAVVLMAAVVGLYPGSAGAVVVGLSDQEPAALGDPLFTALGMHQARLIVPWDAASQDPARVDAWLTAARDAQLTPLVTFEHAATDRCPAAPCRMPSTAEFRAAFEAFRARWPWVTTFGTWNEANHQTQPTMGRPAATGLLYNALVSACRKCTVLAVEVLDEQNMTSWLQTFREFAHEPRLWGLHNYRDVTYGRSDGTQAMLRAVPGDIWVTETGGITYQRTASGVVSQPFDPERAARAIHNAFALARAAAGRISRLYVYNWIAEAGDRFDAGLLAPDASLRPSYYALVDELRAQASGDTVLTLTTPKACVPPGSRIIARLAAAKARVKKRSTGKGRVTVKVSRVNFLVDGKLRVRDRKAAFTATLVIGALKAGSSHQVWAKIFLKVKHGPARSRSIRRTFKICR